MAVANRRWWWKPWCWSSRTWLIVIVVWALLFPLLNRWFILWHMPDVALPFNVEDIIREDVPPDEDAFICYAKATTLLSAAAPKGIETAMTQALDLSVPVWDDRLDQWLINHKKILLEYRKGSELEQSGGPSLKTVYIGTLLTVHQDSRSLARMGALEAMRFERAGDYETAWRWHRANLRCARHIENPGFTICKLVANSIRARLFAGITRWAENPQLTAERLRSARSEVAEEANRRMPALVCAKVEYLSLRNTWRRQDAPDLLGQQWPVNPGIPLIVKHSILWVFGMPELQMRQERQLLVNVADQLGEPLKTRQKTIGTTGPLVFQTSSKSLLPGQLDATQLDRANSNGLLKLVLSNGPFARNDFWTNYRSLDEIVRLDDARVAMLDIVLAVQEFQRNEGHYPDTLEQLVPRYLKKVPLDPMDMTCAPLRYRRQEDEAIVWSVGRDGIDNDGDLDNNLSNVGDLGFRIRLKEAIESNDDNLEIK